MNYLIKYLLSAADTGGPIMSDKIAGLFPQFINDINLIQPEYNFSDRVWGENVVVRTLGFHLRREG